METTDLIITLREFGNAPELPLVRVRELLEEAADRLEALQESVAALSIIKTECKSSVKITPGEVTLELLRANNTEGENEPVDRRQ